MTLINKLALIFIQLVELSFRILAFFYKMILLSLSFVKNKVLAPVLIIIIILILIIILIKNIGLFF